MLAEPRPLSVPVAVEVLVGPCGPALASAVHDAIGIRMCRLPMTPERVLAAIRTGRDDSVPGPDRDSA